MTQLILIYLIVGVAVTEVGKAEDINFKKEVLNPYNYVWEVVSWTKNLLQ